MQYPAPARLRAKPAWNRRQAWYCHTSQNCISDFLLQVSVLLALLLVSSTFRNSHSYVCFSLNTINMWSFKKKKWIKMLCIRNKNGVISLAKISPASSKDIKSTWSSASYNLPLKDAVVLNISKQGDGFHGCAKSSSSLPSCWKVKKSKATRPKKWKPGGRMRRKLVMERLQIAFLPEKMLGK